MKALNEKNLKIAWNSTVKSISIQQFLCSNIATAYLDLKSTTLLWSILNEVCKFLPQNTRKPSSLAIPLRHLGLHILSKGEYEQAEKCLIQAINIFDKYYGTRPSLFSTLLASYRSTPGEAGKRMKRLSMP